MPEARVGLCSSSGTDISIVADLCERTTETLRHIQAWKQRLKMRITLLFALKFEPTASAFDKLMPRRHSELREGNIHSGGDTGESVIPLQGVRGVGGGGRAEGKETVKQLCEGGKRG